MDSANVSARIEHVPISPLHRAVAGDGPRAPRLATSGVLTLMVAALLAKGRRPHAWRFTHRLEP